MIARRIATACGCVLGLAVLRAQTPVLQQPPVFRSGTNFVQVDAYPMKDGRLLTNLEKGDFEIREDGQLQKVETFELVKVDPFTPDGEKRDPNTVDEANAQAADPKNRVFVVYLDAPHVSIASGHAARSPLVQALNRIMAPGDLFGVLTPDVRPSSIAFGRKLTTTDDMMTRYWPWGVRDSIIRSRDEEALLPCTIDPVSGQDIGVNDGGIGRKLMDVLVDRHREDRVFTHLSDTIDYLGAARETRKSLIIFTEGWRLFRDDDSLVEAIQTVMQHYNTVPQAVGLGPGSRLGIRSATASGSIAGCVVEVQRLAHIDDATRFRDLMERARRANVVFYPVNPAGLEVFDIPINQPNANANLAEQQNRVRLRTDHLMEIAENTGGLAVVNTNNLHAGLERIANQLSSYYVLGYYSANTKFDGRYRQIDVKVKAPGVQVTARRGYRAPTEAEMAARNAPKPAVAPAVEAAAAELAAALGSLSRLRSGADLYGWAVRTSPSELTVFAEVAGPLAEKWSEGGDLQVVVTSTTGEAVASGRGRLDRVSRGASARVAVPAAATGPWSAKLRIQNGGELLETSIAVGAAPAASVLSAPLPYRATPGMQSALHPVADFLYRRTERAHVEWMTTAALDSREARVLDRNGNPLAVQVTLGERPGVLVADINLAPLAPGDYVLELVVAASGNPTRRLLAFKVTQ